MKFFLFSIFLVGQTAQASADYINPFLWRIVKDDRVSYIFGSVHDGVSSDKLPKEFWKIFYKAEAVVFEADIPNQARTIENSYLPKGQSLEMFFSKVAMEYLKEIFESSFNISQLFPHSVHELIIEVRQQMACLKESFISTCVKDESEQNLDGSLDAELYQRATAAKKTLAFLETVYEGNLSMHKALQTGSPKHNHFLDIETDILEHGIMVKKATSESILFEAKQNSLAYSRGDNSYLIELETESDQEMGPLFLEEVVGNRNKVWIPKIVKYHQKFSDSLFIVGVLHMGTDFSLSKLLRKEGFTVERIELLKKSFTIACPNFLE